MALTGERKKAVDRLWHEATKKFTMADLKALVGKKAPKR